MPMSFGLRGGRGVDSQRSPRALGRLLSTLVVVAAALLGPGSTAQQGGIANSHGYAIYGQLKYGPGFAHFEYVDPQAPKGGTYRFASQGVTFDSVNQIALLGTIPPAVMYMSDTLLKQSRDEPASYYCLVCKSISWPDDLSWTEFEIDPRARFDDGQPVTPEDIIFSVNLGHGLSMPAFSRVVQTMDRIEKTGPGKVRIHFTMKNNPTLPTVLGTMPIVPRHYWQNRDPFKPTMEVPVTIGPYQLVDVIPGRSVIFRRNREYWAIDHPVNVGRNNFEFVRNDYYRDSQLLNEAFRVGLSDFRLDMNASDMRQEADLPAVLNGDIVRDRLRYENGAIYNSITFNARRPVLSDVRVRKALWLAYDFEWVKRAVLGGDYGRLASYIPNMEFEATGLPGPGELEFLEPYRDQLPPELFTRPPSLPVGGSRERMRANLIEARDLLREAGFVVADGRLIDPRTGQPVQLELVAYSPLLMNQMALFIRNAAKLGIEIEFRSVDAAQMRHLARNYDFDLLYYRENFAPLPTPGAGLAQLYTSQAADTPSQFNRAGIKEPAIDNAIARMIAATDRPTVVNSLRAVDRILRFKYYSIPLQHMYAAPVGYLPISYWDKFGRPEIEQTWQFPYWSADTWWVDPAKEAALSHGVHG
jgi:microcin C transport system substrate-binding protein